ncbi:MAG: photosystem II biogenesis protein Psp29, partial [Pseudanabaenaceae cyanobacterium bins.68]|nr:photosystem II biogenesis protein Psp29 [Pseudanabaenaceae cyanobacterium bins.68]
MNNVRTVAETKQTFYHLFPKPINSVYRRILDELTVELHLLMVNQTFAYDPIFALGVATAFDKFMAGYQPESDQGQMFTALCQSLQLDQAQLQRDRHQAQELAARSPAQLFQLLTSLEPDPELEPLSSLLIQISANPKFKYSRLFGIGLYTLLELCQPEATQNRRQELLTQVGNLLKVGDRCT